MLRFMLASAIGLTMLLSSAARAQCPGQFLTNADQAFPSVDGFISDAVMWDPDGAGPLPEVLVVAGNFTVAGLTPARNIAAWDGRDWHPLGTGLGSVDSLAVWRGRLAAGGQEGVSIFDGAAWSRLSTFSSFISAGSGGIYALREFQGDLVAAGSFSVRSIFSSPYFTNMARWDGAVWRPMGAPPDFSVYTLCEFQNRLIAGGPFTTIGGVACSAIAQWDGAAWTPLGGGMQAGFTPALAVYSCILHNGALIAGGDFDMAGDVATQMIARWDGASWSAVTPGNSGRVYTLASSGGRLFAGGEFDMAGGTRVRNLAYLQNDVWHSAPIDSWQPHGLFALAGQVYVNAGPYQFLRFTGSSWAPFGPGLLDTFRLLTAIDDTLVATIATQLSHWEGNGWTPYPPPPGSVYAATLLEGDLVASVNPAGGSGGQIVRFTPTGWQPVGQPLARRASLLMTLAGETYAVAGTGSSSTDERVYRWDGNAWVGLGTPFNSALSGLAIFNGELIAAGYFTANAGAAMIHIARFDGQQWQPLGDGLAGGSVDSLTIYEGRLVASGTFTAAGNQSASRIAQWDGRTWSPLGGGLTGGNPYPPQGVPVLAVIDHTLYAAGEFDTAGGVPARRVAAWDGAEWRSLGADLSTTPSSGFAHRGILHLASSLRAASGHPSNRWVRYALPTADFDHDGEPGTDQDIEAFFACLSGNCCATCGMADFDADGDAGTDADIEAFFRALAGGTC